MPPMKKRLLIWTLTALMLCFSAVFPTVAEEKAGDDGVTILCLNVGKGDAILIRAEGQCFLVDTGYKRTADALMKMLEREGVTRLNGVFLTHNHKDHYGGLNALCTSGIRIDAFYTSAYCQDGFGADHPLVIAAARRGQTVRPLKGGDQVRLSDTAVFDVLAPVRLNNDNENNNSLVMQLETADGSVLLTGDMKFEEEYDLISQGLLRQTDVLKVAFHGDNSSTSMSFLSAVRPRVGLISTSTAEEKDTPSRDVLQRLASVGCAIYVTQDAAYAVRVVLKDGKAAVTREQ